MKQQRDFYKIYDSADRSRLIAVVNLNCMFPVPQEEIKPLLFKNSDHHRAFQILKEKSKYVDLLKKRTGADQ